jgi:hypothetical protein
VERNESLEILTKEVAEYIKGTLGQHYSSGHIECFDILENDGCARDFCKGNAIKYLIRYGKKNGMNKIDLMKSIHYILLLLHYDNNNEEK